MAALLTFIVLAGTVLGDPVAATLTVPAGAGLQQALNGAPSGDTILRQFVDFNGRDYQLLPRRSWIGAGRDGRDLGVDLSQLTLDPARAIERPAR